MANETSPTLRDPSSELTEPVAAPSKLLEWLQEEIAKNEARQFVIYWLPPKRKRRKRTAKTVNAVLLPTDESVTASTLEVANLVMQACYTYIDEFLGTEDPGSDGFKFRIQGKWSEAGRPRSRSEWFFLGADEEDEEEEQEEEVVEEGKEERDDDDVYEALGARRLEHSSWAGRFQYPGAADRRSRRSENSDIESAAAEQLRTSSSIAEKQQEMLSSSTSQMLRQMDATLNTILRSQSQALEQLSEERQANANAVERASANAVSIVIQAQRQAHEELMKEREETRRLIGQFQQSAKGEREQSRLMIETFQTQSQATIAANAEALERFQRQSQGSLETANAQNQSLMEHAKETIRESHRQTQTALQQMMALAGTVSQSSEQHQAIHAKSVSMFNTGLQYFMSSQQAAAKAAAKQHRAEVEALRKQLSAQHRREVFSDVAKQAMGPIAQLIMARMGIGVDMGAPDVTQTPPPGFETAPPHGFETAPPHGFENAPPPGFEGQPSGPSPDDAPKPSAAWDAGGVDERLASLGGCLAPLEIEGQPELPNSEIFSNIISEVRGPRRSVAPRVAAVELWHFLDQNPAISGQAQAEIEARSKGAMLETSWKNYQEAANPIAEEMRAEWRAHLDEHLELPAANALHQLISCKLVAETIMDVPGLVTVIEEAVGSEAFAKLRSSFHNDSADTAEV